jgi:cytochrome P450
MTVSPEQLGPSYFQDPHPLQARLREEGPVRLVRMPEGFDAWLVTRYADVRAALADQRLWKDWRKLAPPGAQPPDDAESFSPCTCSTWIRPITSGCAGW